MSATCPWCSHDTDCAAGSLHHGLCCADQQPSTHPSPYALDVRERMARQALEDV